MELVSSCKSRPGHTTPTCSGPQEEGTICAPLALRDQGSARKCCKRCWAPFSATCQGLGIRARLEGGRLALGRANRTHTHKKIMDCVNTLAPNHTKYSEGTCTKLSPTSWAPAYVSRGYPMDKARICVGPRLSEPYASEHTKNRIVGIRCD